MKVYFLITGLLRTFITTLYPFLNELSKRIDCEFILFTSHENEDSKFSGITFIEQLHEILKNKQYTLHVETPAIRFINPFTQREKNTVYQWLRITSAINFIRQMGCKDSDLIVRIRPDINILSSIQEFIKLLDPEERKITLSLLGYPEYSMGRLMTPEYIAVNEEWTAMEVLNHIRLFGKDSETIDVIYVVNEKGQLIK
jgi:Mg/Co/Ni transporter MgtE